MNVSESKGCEKQEKQEQTAGGVLEVNDEDAEGSELQPEKEKSQVPEDDPIPDQRLIDFLAKTEELKDQMTCDEVFCMYLREVSKRVNENYYKQCLRFILLYRECINECGWAKRRETYKEAGMLEEDTFLAFLKTQEERQEELSKQQLETLRPKEVHVFDYTLDLGDLCPKFQILSSDDLPDVAPPRKSSNIT